MVTLEATDTLVEQGQRGTELYLLLDGVIAVEVDGAPVAEVGPGAVVGERATLEGGVRTSTLRAVTNCRLAKVDATQLDPASSTSLPQDIVVSSPTSPLREERCAGRRSAPPD